MPRTPSIAIALLTAAAAATVSGAADDVRPAEPRGTTPVVEQLWPGTRTVQRGPARVPPVLAAGGISLRTISIDDDPDGDMPRALAYTPDGTLLCVANRDTDNVVVFDATTNTAVATIDVGDFPVDIQPLADGRMVVANVFGNSVSVVDPMAGTSIEIPVTGAEPIRVKPLPDGTVLVGLVNDAANSSFSIVDPDLAVETASFASGPQGAIGFSFNVETAAFKNLFTDFAVTPDGALVFQPDRANDQVLVFEVATQSILDLVPVAAGPEAVAIDPTGTYCVVSSQTDDVITRIDVATRGVDWTSPAADLRNQVIRIGLNGTRVITWTGDTIDLRDAATGALQDSNPLGPLSVGDLRVTTDDQYVFISNFNSRVIDLSNADQVASLTLAPTDEAVAHPTEPRIAAVRNVFGEDVHFYTVGATNLVEGAAPSGEPAEGDGPFTVDIVAGGALAVVGNVVSGNASVIELDPDLVRAWVPAGARVKEARITPDGQTALVCAADGNAAVVVDLATDTAVASLPIFTRPGHVRFSPDSSEAYVLNIAGSDRLSFIALDGASSSIITQRPVGQTGAANGPTYTEWSGIEISPDGSTVVVCDSFNDALRIFDTASRTEVATIPTGDFPLRVNFSPDSTRAYVVNHFDDSVTVVQVDGASSTIVGTVGGVDRFPLTVDVDPSGDFAYVGTRDSGGIGVRAIRVIDTSNLTIVATLPLPGTGYPRDSRVDPNTDELIVGATDAQLHVIDAAGAASAITASVPLSTGPKEIALDPVSRTVLAVGPAVDAVDVVSLPGGAAPCPADLDGSGDVGFDDLLAILTDWGGSGPADLDGSGTVDFPDLLLVLTDYGPCP